MDSTWQHFLLAEYDVTLTLNGTKSWIRDVINEKGLVYKKSDESQAFTFSLTSHKEKEDLLSMHS